MIWAIGAGSASAQAIHVWTGLGADNKWTTAENWEQNAPPFANNGDSLQFPSTAAQLSTVNDYPDGSHFAFIEFDSGYTVAGIGDNRLIVDQQIIAATGGTDISALIALPGDHPLELQVATLSSLTLHTIISGSGGIVKNGGGAVILAGESPNQYTGVTTVNAGTLTLEQQGGGAIPDGVIIGDDLGGLESDIVTLEGEGQIAGNITVNSSGLLFIDSDFNNIMSGALTIKGGLIQTTAGVLGLGGDVTVPDGSTGASIQGHVSLGSETRTFHVGHSNANVPALQIVASIVGDTDSGLTKTGPGWLRLGGSNSYTGPTIVQDGRLTASTATALGNGSLSVTQHGQLHFDSPFPFPMRTLTLQTDNTVPAMLCGAGGVAAWPGEIVLAGGANQIATATGCTLQLGPIQGPGDLVISDGGNGVVFTNGNTNTGKTHVVAGTVRLQPPAAGISYVSAVIVDNATLDLHDMPTNQGMASLAGSGQVLLGDVLLLMQNQQQDAIFSGNISGDFAIAKTGIGNWILSGNNPFIGNINLAGGPLTIDGSLAGGVELSTGNGAAQSVLYGVGTLGSIEAEGAGRVQPGHATEPGKLTSQSIDLTPATTFGAIVKGADAGTGYSQLVVKGTVTLGGATLDLNVDPNFLVASNGKAGDLVLIDNDGTDPIDGTFANLPEGAIVTSASGIEFRISYVGGSGNDVILTARANEYFLSEGSTGPFFDTDVLIANPNPTTTPITIKFLKDDGTTVSIDRTLTANSRTTVHVDDIVGMESTAFSTIVTSHSGAQLVVERTMSWDKTGYGGHTEKATSGAANTWFFAEGAQGFYSTFLLLMNPQNTTNTATVQYLIEGAPAVTRTYALAATSRRTIDLGTESALQSRSFGMIVTFNQPGVAERAMYFGTNPIWKGGHESAGVNAPSTTWYVAEGATGSYFTTFILLANPNPIAADATLTFLPASGKAVTKTKTVPAFGRVTVNIADEDPSLKSAAVSTTVTTTGTPILVERSQYWPFTPDQWQEAHNSEGVTDLSPSWGLAEGRVGGDQSYQTYILIGNPQTKAAGLSIIFLREDGTTVTKTFVVQPMGRLNVAVGPGTDVPELVNERFGAVITSDQPIVVERSMYWNANGIVWAAGTSATATKLLQ